MSSKSMSTSSIPSSNDDEVAAVIRAAYQRAATFESDCSNLSNANQSDIEKCLAEVCYYDASRSSREATPPSSSKEDYLLQQPSSYPPGSDKVHIDWSEHYDRQESHDEIDVDRFASRRRSSNKATQYYKRNVSSWSSSSADVDAVDTESATADADYDDNNDPIIYVSNHSLHSMSTLGTMGLFTTQYSNESSAKKGKSFTTNQEGEHTEQSIVLDHAINERSAKPPTPPPPSTPPLKRQKSAPEWQQRSSLPSRQNRKVFEQNLLALNQASKNPTRTQLSPIPQSPYVVEGATPVVDTPLTYTASSAPAPQHKQPVSCSRPREELAWQDRDRKVFEQNVTALNQASTNPRTKLSPPLPYKAMATTVSRDVLSENKHSSSEINLTSTVAIRRDPFDENLSKSWPAGGRSPTGGISQSHQHHQKTKNDDDLLKKIKIGYQNDREKECLPPPPPSQPRQHTQSPHSVTCAVSPTDSEELAHTHSVVKQQSKNAEHPGINGGLKHNRQDRTKLPHPPFSNDSRPMQQDSSTKKTFPTSKSSICSTMQPRTQRDFNTTLMKLQHRVELSKRTNGLAARQYHARHFWFYSVPISTCFIMSMILVMMCAINSLDTDERIGLAMGSVFCSILATVFYFLDGKFGMNHHAALHTTARNEMTKAGFRLDQLSKYKGCGLVSGLHSTKACTGAIRTLHRLDVYIEAINQYIPATPKGIDNVYKLLNNQINKICRTCPSAIESRLSYFMDDDNWGGDNLNAGMAPFDLVADAYICLEEELRKFILYPVFLPNAEDVVARTIDIFFQDTTEDSDSSSYRNTESTSLM